MIVDVEFHPPHEREFTHTVIMIHCWSPVVREIVLHLYSRAHALAPNRVVIVCRAHGIGGLKHMHMPGDLARGYDSIQTAKRKHTINFLIRVEFPFVLGMNSKRKSKDGQG